MSADLMPVERIMRWLKANGVTASANEIIRDSLHADQDWIRYEMLQNGIRSGVRFVPHTVAMSAVEDER